MRWNSDGMMGSREVLMISRTGWIIERFPLLFAVFTYFFYLICILLPMGWFQKPYNTYIYMYMCVMYICYLRTDTDRNIQRVLLFRLLSWLVSSNWFVHICFKQLLLYWQEKPKQKQQSQKGEPPEVEALSDAMEIRWDDGLTWGVMIRVDSARTLNGFCSSVCFPE